MINKGLFTSTTDLWETPQDLWQWRGVTDTSKEG